MIEVEVEDAAWSEALSGCEAVVTNAALSALNSAGMSGLGVTVLLTSDAEVQSLNAQFRGQDKPTNVLSFPAPDTARPHLGDVALAYGVCASEAQAQGKTLDQHLAHLTAHGVLHLLGYDHESEAQADDMERLERVILAGLGYPDPYETDVQH
jgi:probable rRNA maturation factor